MLATDNELEAKIARGVELTAICKAGEEAKAELELLKKEFREAANGQDLRLETPAGAAVTVEQKGDSTMRSVPGDLMEKCVKLAGDALFELFTLQPSKGSAKSFELNVLRALPKKAGQSLVALLSVRATPWVKFSRAA